MKKLFLFFMVLSQSYSYATHNRAGEITYEQIDNLKIRATITTYTKASSQAADRDSLTLCWGDGLCETVPRNNGNGNGVTLNNDIKYNTYVAEHTYPGVFQYTMYMTDPNRNNGILNVNSGNSDQIEFHLETTVYLLSLQFQGFNSSPILLQPPIDIGYVDEVFQHTPNAYDPDGDSIAYELITPLMDLGTDVTDYSDITTHPSGPDNQKSFDVTTGLLTWTTPQTPGEYNVAMLVKSYRNGVLNGTIVRDIQIEIRDANNKPPEIETIEEICVVAGETVSFEVIGTDDDIGQSVVLTATGGPLEPTFLNNPATFNPNGPATGNPVSYQFEWNTSCDNIREQYYQIVFKARDDFQNTEGATSFKIVRIKVIGPQPLNPTTSVLGTQVEICWEAPYACENSDLFQGFSVWRKPFCDGAELDTCFTGLAGLGYSLLAVRITSNNGSQYCYTDNTAQPGALYSYRIVADFALTSAGGFLFNPSQGQASEEICVQLEQDVPLLINVDVTTTNSTSGEIFVRWTRPKAEDLDTIQNPGPYRFELFRSEGPNGAGFGNTPIYIATANTFSGITLADTSYNDNGLNTVENAYSYRVDFYVSGNLLLGSANIASSIFLTAGSSDNSVNLNWEENTPWNNFEYNVYREDPVGSGTFVSIATVSTPEYNDLTLENGVEYCYYIESSGTYAINGVPSPLINKSQIACAIPADTTPPCPPVISLTNACEDGAPGLGEEDFFNTLTWTIDQSGCADDVVSYNIYYAPNENTDLALIGTVLEGEPLTFQHQPSPGSVAGCYAVTAIDSVDVDPSIIQSGGNESSFSNIICIDNCPIYELPNAFTPNGDGANELFVPFPGYRFIARIDLKVYNRWGQLVFATTDPAINWDGTDQGSKQNLKGGVYFYTCEVYELRLDGEIQQTTPLKGYIELIRGQ